MMVIGEYPATVGYYMMRIQPLSCRIFRELFLVSWSALILSLNGCTLPPDVVPSPDPGPEANIDRDASLSSEEPIPSRILEEAVANPEVHSAILLEYGDDALMARIHMIRAARKSIDIQTFIWVYDRSGKWIYKELLEAARRGVQVRILVDQFIPPGISAEEYATLATAHENLRIRLYRPLTVNAINTTFQTAQNTFTRFATMNHRMHNKVFLVDKRIAIIGGRNIQDAYFDRDPGLTFRDRDVIVSGPACNAIARSFEDFWEYDECHDASAMQDLKKALLSGTAKTLESMDSPLHASFADIDTIAGSYDFSTSRPHLQTHAVEKIHFHSDFPLKSLRKKAHIPPFREVTQAIRNTEHELLIQTPYSVVDEKTYKVWKKIRKNSQVRVRFSSNSLASADHVYVGSIALKHRRMQIKGLGVELYLSRPVPGDIYKMVPRYDSLLHESVLESHPNWNSSEDVMPLNIVGPRFCIHAKSMVFDRKSCLVGSHNFDPRSSHLNTECVVMIRDPAFSELVASKIDLSFEDANSWVVAERKGPPVISEVNNLISFISTSLPVFDIWPIEHISCYELKEGMEPLSPYDKDFHEHYKDAGPFPGLDIGLEPIKVRLLRAVGGPAARIM